MRKNEIDILFFLEGVSVPSSRFRVLQYLPKFAADGIQCKLLYCKPSKYALYPGFLRNNVLRYPYAFGTSLLIICTRIFQILLCARRAKVIVLQRDFLFRINSSLLERFLRSWISGRQISLILDVDDAIYVHPQKTTSFSLARKIEQIARLCDLVIAGNQELYEHFSRWAPTVIVPTVVDHKNFKPDTRDEAVPPIICWTGQSSNYIYLQALAPVFERLAQEFSFRIRVIAEQGASAPFESQSVPIEMCIWSKDLEVAQLQDIAIGIMPLSDGKWERGKCGFKLLQYMALGKAAVASPVGVNSEIAGHGRAALLAGSEEQWYQQLRRLLSDSRLRASIGESARRQVEQHYSIERWYPTLKDLLCPRKKKLESAE